MQNIVEQITKIENLEQKKKQKTKILFMFIN